MSSLKVYRVQFHADLGRLVIKTPVTCTITATWKRSAEVAKSTAVEFSNGQANFDQTISIPVNMYYEEATTIFQEKKSLFSFTLHTPKGEKNAGSVTVDLASMLNNKLECKVKVNVACEENYKLDKCPDKDAKVFIRIRAELIGEQNPDSLSQVSGISANNPVNASTLDASLISSLSLSKGEVPAVFASMGSKKDNSGGASPFSSIGASPLVEGEVQLLRQQLAKTLSEKAELEAEVEKLRAGNECSTPASTESGDADLRKEVDKLTKQLSLLKTEMQKSKAIQDKLERQLNQTRNDHHEHEKELYATRVKLDEVYNQLVNALGSYI